MWRICRYILYNPVYIILAVPPKMHACRSSAHFAHGNPVVTGRKGDAERVFNDGEDRLCRVSLSL